MTPKHALDLCLGLLLSALILAGIEFSLAGLGAGEVVDTNNWSRGFDPTARYLVPLEESPGAWQTRFKHKTYPEVTIPAKSAKVRVITFGGSNVHGFPTRYLKNLLNRKARGLNREELEADSIAKDDDPPEELFEVINLGRPGYGSERVKFIFEQALRELEPDVVILYTGHNEFVERGFQLDLEVASVGGWAQGPLALARETRLFNSLAQHFAARNQVPSSTRQAEPEAWDNEYSKFIHITYAETQAYFQALQANVAAMCEMATQRGVPMILSTVVYNRLSVPHSSTFSAGVSQEDIAHFESKRMAALDALPRYLQQLLPLGEEKRLHGLDFEVRRPDRSREPVTFPLEDFDGWRAATGLLANRDPRMRPEECWSESVKPFYAALQLFQQRALGNKPRGAIVQAEKDMHGALAIIPDHPRALFELALIESLLERDPKRIRELFERAAALDRAPRKGSEATNDLVREVAAEFPSITLLDMDRALQACVPNGLIGWEWMADHCHPLRGARDAMMELLCETLYASWPDIVEVTRKTNSQAALPGEQR